MDAYLQYDQRLLLPIGTCDSSGPHLPLGAATLVANAFVGRLAEEFSILRAPPLHYGVHARGERKAPGTAALRSKTLHATLNDLLADWESNGFQEFILLTAEENEAHIETIASATARTARVRVLEILDIDFEPLLHSISEAARGGEVLTSLLLFLAPELVRIEYTADDLPRRRLQHPTAAGPIPASAAGPHPSGAAPGAELGSRLYEYIYEKIRTRIFLRPE